MSNDNVDYYSKYLKYKKKYLDLQAEIEGGKPTSKTPPATKGTPASAKSDKVAKRKALYAPEHTKNMQELLKVSWSLLGIKRRFS